MRFSDRIALVALVFSIASGLVAGAFYLASDLARIDKLSNLIGSAEERTGIYAEIHEAIGDRSQRTGLYAELDRVKALPAGTILAWIPTTKQPDVPDGWVLYDGTTAGVPDLSGMFLRGVASKRESKQLGGRTDIPDDGSHDHGSRTGVVYSNRITYEHGGDDNGVWFEHRYQIGIGKDHNHGGDNLPPNFSIMYIMKTG